MAGVKITDLESLANAEDSDFLIIIDHSGLETKKISRGEFLREVNIDSSEILSLIDSDYLKSIIDEGYIQSHASEDYIKSLADQDYIRSFVDSDYVALKAPPIPDFGLMDFTAGQNVFAGDVLVLNSDGKVERASSSGPAINSASPIDLSTNNSIPHSINFYNKFDGFFLYQSGYELYAGKFDSDGSIITGAPAATPFIQGTMSVSTDNKQGNHFVCFGAPATAIGGYIDSDLSIQFTNTVSLNSYQNVDNWGGDLNYSVYDENQDKYVWFSPGGGGDAYKPYQAVLTLNESTAQIITVESTSGWDSDELQTSYNQIDPIFFPSNGIYVTFATDAADNTLKVFAGKINSETGLIEKADSAVELFDRSSSLISLSAFRLGKESNQFIVYGNQRDFTSEEGYTDYDNDFFYQFVTVQDLNTIVVGERQSMRLANDFTSTAMGMAYDENDDSILVFWRNSYNRWKRQLGVIRDDKIEFSNPSSFSSEDYGMAYNSFNTTDKFPDFAYHEARNKVVSSTVVYGNDLFSLVFDNGDFQTTNNDFIGIANENITTNLSGKVVVSRGISDKVSGLIPGSPVYLDMTGNLTSTKTRYGVVGRALDSDQVLITRSHSESLESQADVLITDLKSNQSLMYDGAKWVNKNFRDIDGFSVDSDAVEGIITNTVTSSYLAENMPDLDAGSAVFLSSDDIVAGDLVILNDDNTIAKPSSDGNIVSNSETDISISTVVSQPEIFRNLQSGDFITTYTVNTPENGQNVSVKYLILGSVSPEGDVSFGLPYRYDETLTDIVTDGTNVILISITYNDGVYASLLDYTGNTVTEISDPVKLVSLTNSIITGSDLHKPSPKAGYNPDNNTFALFCNDDPIKFQIVDDEISVHYNSLNRTIDGWISNGGEVKYVSDHGFYVALIADNYNSGGYRIRATVINDRGISFEKESEYLLYQGHYRLSALGDSQYFSINVSNGNWYFYNINGAAEIAQIGNGGNSYGLDNTSYSMFAYDNVNGEFIQKDYVQINLGFNQDPPAFPPGAAGGVNHLYRKFIVSDNEIVYDNFPTYIPGQRLGLFEYSPTFNLFVEGNYQSLNTVDASSQTNVDKFIGFASEDISTNAFGSVTLLGGINRNFSGLTPGPYYTDFFGNVTPTPTEYGIVGVAINDTTMLVNRPLNFSLKELDGVAINEAKLTTGQVLTYSGDNWSNINLPKILTKEEVFDLIDVTYVKARLNEINISELQNVSNVAPNIDQVLGWTGSEWRPKTILDSADIERMTLDSAEITDLIDTDYLKQTLPPIEAGFKLFEASGAITAGNVVSLNDDGTVSEIVAQGGATRNSSINFQISDDRVTPLAQNLDENDILFVYWDDDNQKSILVPGYINVDGTIGLGDEFESVGFKIQSIASLGSEFILVYVSGSYAYAIIGESSDGIITAMGDPQQITTVSTKSVTCAYSDKTQSYVISYISGSSFYASRLVIDSDSLISVVHDGFIETPSYRWMSSNYYGTRYYNPIDQTIFERPSMSYNETYGFLVAVFPTRRYAGYPYYNYHLNYVILFLEDNGFSFSGSSETANVASLSNNYGGSATMRGMESRITDSHIILRWSSYQYGSNGRAIYSYTSNKQVERLTTTTSAGYYGYSNSTSKFLDASSNSYVEFYFDTEGNRINEPFTTTGQSSLPSTANFIYNDYTGFIVEQIDATSVRTVDASVQTTADKFIGIASETLADGETGSINIFAGVNHSVSGLQRGKDYYLTALGDLTTTPTDYGIVGRAIDTNAFVITKSAEPVLNDIGDVAISLASLSTGQVLTYTGNSWTNRTPFEPITEREIIDLIDEFSLNPDEAVELVDSDYVIARMLPTVKETVDSDYVIGKMLPTVISTVDNDYVGPRATPAIISTVDSDYIAARLNLNELVSALILGGDSNQDDGDGTFVGSINQIIDDRVTESYLSAPVHSIVNESFLSPIIDSDYIVNRIDLGTMVSEILAGQGSNEDSNGDSSQDFVGNINKIIDDRVNESFLSPIVDSDYIADRLDLNRFFDFATDSNGETSLTLSEETIIRNINETVDSDYVIARMLPTVVSTVDSDYIKSKISLDELFTAITGDSDADDGESFLSGIEDIIDERVTAEYIAERFSVAAFIASVPDLPVDTSPPD